MIYYRNNDTLIESVYEFNYPILENYINKCSTVDNSFFIMENTTYVKNCLFALTEDMIESCNEDIDIIKQNCILEAVKIDWLMKNFLSKPNDYKGLKQDMKTIISANNLDDSKLKTNKKGILQACKRVLIVLSDIMVPGGAAATALGLGAIVPKIGATAATVSKAATTASKVHLLSKATAGTVGTVAGLINPIVIVGGIVAFILGFILNRLIRLAIDNSEFNNIKDDCYQIIDQLEANANATSDPKLKKQYLDAAKQLRDSVIKHDRSSNPNVQPQVNNQNSKDMNNKINNIKKETKQVST